MGDAGMATVITPDCEAGCEHATAKKRTDNFDEQLGIWVPASGTYNTDTTLEFFPEGTCEYKFYATPGDSTSQVSSVKGNFIQTKDTVLIEWQKNSFTPLQKMKLVLKTKKIKSNVIFD